MNRILVYLYRDQWVLSSSQRSAGGGRLDAHPVRLIRHNERAALASALRQLAVEDVPVVPQPDWHDPIYKVGIRAQALGLKTWLSFVRNARCFNIEERENSLVLEEWPREGGSFTAEAAWRTSFHVGDLDAVAEHLVANIPPIGKGTRIGQKRSMISKGKSRGL